MAEDLTLILELRAGHVPQIAIFYDGINESASAHVRQVAGETSLENEIGFYESAPQRVEQMSFLELVAMKSALVKAAVNLVARDIERQSAAL